MFEQRWLASKYINFSTGMRRAIYFWNVLRFKELQDKRIPYGEALVEMGVIKQSQWELARDDPSFLPGLDKKVDVFWEEIQKQLKVVFEGRTVFPVYGTPYPVCSRTVSPRI